MFKDTTINENERKKKIGTKQVTVEIGSITGKRRSDSIFKYFKTNLIFQVTIWF